MHRAYKLIEHDLKIVESFLFTSPPSHIFFYRGEGVQPLQNLPMVLVALAKSSYCSGTAMLAEWTSSYLGMSSWTCKNKIRHYSSFMETW